MPLQFEILYDVWSSKGWCTDTGEILGPFFVIEEFIALYTQTLRLMMLYARGYSAWRKNAVAKELLTRVLGTIFPCFSVRATTHIRKVSYDGVSSLIFPHFRTFYISCDFCCVYVKCVFQLMFFSELLKLRNKLFLSRSEISFNILIFA